MPATVAFVALTAGFLGSRSHWAMGSLLTRRSWGAKLMRCALSGALPVLGPLGWSISKPLLTEVHFAWVEGTVLAVVTTTILAGFIGWTAFIVDRSDGEEQRAEAANADG